MIGRPFIFLYHPYTPNYKRRETEERWMRGKRDKVFVESRLHLTYLCGGLSVYATYGCACITTLNDSLSFTLALFGKAKNELIAYSG